MFRGLLECGKVLERENWGSVYNRYEGFSEWIDLHSLIELQMSGGTFT